jgi:hypothetical protein
VLIEDPRIAETERLIFEHVWRTLEPQKTAELAAAYRNQGLS